MEITNKKIEGFTLVEIAIVIVIIGLIIGGVVGGQSLIQSTKRNSVIKEYNSFKIAINAFKLEYDSLPGDMRDATDYWGTDSSRVALAVAGLQVHAMAMATNKLI